jgi:hypothetical protein
LTGFFGGPVARGVSDPDPCFRAIYPERINKTEEE